MNYGKLRHKLSLQTPESTTDKGIVTTTWYPAGEVFADVSQLSGRELEQARQIVAEATHQIKTRWSPSRFEPKQRLLMDGRYFYIENVNNVGERNREMILTCVERTNG